MKMKWLLLIVAGVFILSSWQTCADYRHYWEGAEEFEVTPKMVADGDTFYSGKKGYRIVGIDTPELHTRVKPKGQLAEEAKEFFEEFTERFSEKILSVGQDVYGRELVYLFASDGSSVYFYEASVTEIGLARPLIYEKNAFPDLILDVVRAYEEAWKERRGIFSFWESAPLLKKGDNWKKMIGRIVWVEDEIEKVIETGSYYIARGRFASFLARKDGYRYAFKDFDFHSLKGKKVRVYGELWEYKGRPEIVVRAPFEIVVLKGDDEK